jgi:drug/metabolite transporter (DMT)-like permease
VPAFSAVIVLPLLAALLFTISALLLKRSSELGAGLWRTAFVCNVLSGVLYSGLLGFGGPPVRVALLWQPACVALCLFAGLLTQFLALEKGDVSVAVPVLGLKVVVVALLSPLLTSDSVDARSWAAVVLCVSGIALLNLKHAGRRPHNIGITLLAAGFTAVSFAMFDVLVQRWGPAWGVGRLLPLVFGINAVLSLGLILKFRAPLSALPRQTWKWLLGGGVFLGLQSILFVSTLAVWGKATVANVMYSSRGLLSVVLVWLVGHWFANREQGLGARTLTWRLAGAALMLGAIVLVMTR